MPANNGLKVCTFNAKYDPVDYKCCAKTKSCNSGCDSKSKPCNSCKHQKSEIPDSLLAALISIQILPSHADIYNIQNVNNKCIVEHLLKEIARVKDIMDEVDPCDPCCPQQTTPRWGTFAQQPTIESSARIMSIACKLNEFPYLCEDAQAFKDVLSCCNLCGLDYVDLDISKDGEEEMRKSVTKYLGTEEYNAYHNGSCLTLIKKSLCIVPETKEIPCVDSLVAFFEHECQRFINVNVNLGCLDNSFEDVGHKKSKADSIVCFLKKYEDCGAIIMNGAFGDIDYDTPQLFFRGDAFVPEFAQRMLAEGIKPNPVPSDFPCDLCNPIYEIMEFLLKNCKAEHIPYAWLLQYLRLQNCKKCNLFKLIPNKCDRGCKKPCCSSKSVLVDKRSGNSGQVHSGSVVNRAQLRQLKNKSDKKDNHGHDHGHNDKNDHHNKQVGHINNCTKPACVSAKKCCCEPVCETICKTCKVQLKKCHCDDSKCEVRCKEPFECKCDDSVHKIKDKSCKDLCKKQEKACCDSCSKGKKCEDSCDEDVCPTCDDFIYCDPLSVLKRELCLYNTLNNIKDVNDRFTGYYNHFNKSLDCKYPRGMFQAWAMCKDYEKPCDNSRVIDNNSELLALDHFLISDCIKANVANVCLSEMCIEKCGEDVKDMIKNKWLNAYNEFPYGVCSQITPINGGNYVFQYAGSVVKSVFTHRMYCVILDFPHKTKGCQVECGETLHGLGLTALWGALCSAGCDSVSIKVFEKFGLDKHPYFKNYFWNSLEKHSSASDFDDIVETLMESGGCDSDAIIWIQKNNSICEEEFYKHLLCIFSNSDSRDRFILTISIMEALYRLNKMSDILSEDTQVALSDANAVKLLFVMLSVCFKSAVEWSKFIAELSKLFDAEGEILDRFFNSQTSSSMCTPKIPKILNIMKDISDSLEDIVALIQALSIYLKNNCIFMEVLIRHAMKILTSQTGKDCGSGAGCESLQSIWEKLTDDSQETPALMQFLQALNINDDTVEEFMDGLCEALTCGNAKAYITEQIELHPEIAVPVLVYIVIGGDFMSMSFDINDLLALFGITPSTTRPW